MIEQSEFRPPQESPDPGERRSVGDAIRTYVLIGAILMISASAVRFHNYVPKLVMVAVITGIYAATSSRQTIRNAKPVSATAFFLMGLIVLVPLMRDEPNLSPYFTLILTIAQCLLLIPFLSLNRFGEAYGNTMTALAATSLVFFVGSLLIPGWVTQFPLVRGVTSDYRDAFIHVYIISRGIGTEGAVLARNSGFAWEPGAYAALLCLALIFCLYSAETRGRTLWNAWRVSVLIVSVISTMSFTGFVCLAILVVSFRQTLALLLQRSFAVLLTGSAALAFAASTISSQTRRSAIAAASAINSDLSGRIAYYLGEGWTSARERLSLDAIDSLHGSLLIVGDSFSGLERRGLRVDNSVLQSVLALGLVFTLLMAVLYSRFALHIEGHSLAVILVLVVCFSAENFFRSYLFMYVAFAVAVTPADHTDGLRSVLSPSRDVRAQSRNLDG